MNYVPFAEKVTEMVTDLYKATANHPAVVNEHVLQHVIKVRAGPRPWSRPCRLAVPFSTHNGAFTLM